MVDSLSDPGVPVSFVCSIRIWNVYTWEWASGLLAILQVIS